LSRRAIAQYEATVVLVVVSLSLASVVYEGLKPETRLDTGAVFVNQSTQLGGDPAIERLSANSSTPVTVSSLEVDSLDSHAGVLSFAGGGYSVSAALCRPGQTTFFSVYATEPGTVTVATDGQAWIAGLWAPSAVVSAGWQELMISGGSACTIALPGGQRVAGSWSAGSSLVSSVPLEGSMSGQEFVLFLPTGGAAQHVLLTTSGGFDDASA